MVRIFNTLVSADGSPIQGGSVLVDLMWNRVLQPVAQPISSEYFFDTQWVTVSDASGLWEVNLVPNASITPAGNAYRITEKPRRYSYYPTTYYIVVPPESSTPVDYYVGDIKIDKPDWAKP